MCSVIVMNKTRKNTDQLILIITSMLRDVQKRHHVVYTPRAMELDLKMIELSVARNGMEVLTKHLPALGKALDRALTEQVRMSPEDKLFQESFRSSLTEEQTYHLIDCTKDFDPGRLPVLFRSLFSRVFTQEGTVLPNSDVDCVKSLRQLCYTFYKLELPYSLEEEQKVLDQFVKTEQEVSSYNKLFGAIADSLDYDQPEWTGKGTQSNPSLEREPDPIKELSQAFLAVQPQEYRNVIRDARRLLMRLFQRFDPKAIVPKHGPGAVATRERLWGKYMFERVNPRIDAEFPFNEYFVASGGHLCDSIKITHEMNNLCEESFAALTRYEPDAAKMTDRKIDLDGDLNGLTAFAPIGDYYTKEGDRLHLYPTTSRKGLLTLTVGDQPARVILVPKDSRGPRLISCEPLENQWIQQGIMEAIVRHVEKHPLTRDAVHFTHQEHNQNVALMGSRDGRYATLDLKEASDRVSLGLVRLLFPEHLYRCLAAVRTTSTVLPNGQVQNLDKHAPMGSALCFPIMALSIWALLTARFHDDAHARQSMLVYGDDVIVPGYQAQNAIKTLEAFGLLVNQDKSCFTGFFRESCGMDAYKGVPVTPVRVRTLWSHRSSPKSYLSYIAYANAFRKNGYIEVSDRITEWLCRLYGEVPCKDMDVHVPCLDVVPEAHRPKRWRTNKRLQKREWYVTTVGSHNVKRKIPGWLMLLRYFSETSSVSRAPGLYLSDIVNDKPRRSGMEDLNCVDYMIEPFSVRLYTPRDSVVLEKSWR